MRRVGREVCYGDLLFVEKDGLILAINKIIFIR